MIVSYFPTLAKNESFQDWKARAVGFVRRVDFFWYDMIRHGCQYNFSGFRSLRRQFLANLKSDVVKVECGTRPLNGFLINRAALNVLEG